MTPIYGDLLFAIIDNETETITRRNVTLNNETKIEWTTPKLQKHIQINEESSMAANLFCFHMKYVVYFIGKTSRGGKFIADWLMDSMNINIMNEE